tara:strand:+ start:253 stop:534 length:282 start_codon:yes stop_codon:yes gene_type:complete
MNKGKTMITEFYRVSRRVNGKLDILDWTESKKEIFKIIKSYTGLTPNGTFSAFCEGIEAARAKGKEEISVYIGQTPFFLPTSVTPTVEIEIQV